MLTPKRLLTEIAKIRAELTLKKRFLILVSSGLLLSLSLLLIMGYFMFTPLIKRYFLSKVDFLARHYASAAIVGLIFKDKDYLKRLAKSVLNESEIVGLEVFDAKGNLLIQVGTITPKTPFLEKEIKQIPDEETLIFSSSSPKRYGRIRVYYTMEPFHRVLRKLLIFALALSLSSAFFLGIAVYVLVSRAVVTPLNRLAKAILKVREGQLEFNEPVTGAKEVQNLARAFGEMVESLKESQAQLRRTYEEMAEKKTLAEIGEFSLIIAHEIKNPLSIIKGSLDILKKAEIPGETREQMVQYIEEEVIRINELVQNFLTFARPKHIKKEVVKLQSIFKELADKFCINENNFCINIQVEPSLELALDIHWFPQIILNILQNAKEAGATKITIEAHKISSTKEILVIISDNGPGIPEEELERIFKPFYSTKTKGAGLGLAIVEQLVKLHRGRIEVASTLGRGTTFRLYFPED